MTSLIKINFNVLIMDNTQVHTDKDILESISCVIKKMLETVEI